MKRHFIVHGCVALAILIMLSGSLLACGGGASTDKTTGETRGIQFPDPAFDALIRDLLTNYRGVILAEDLLKIRQINGQREGIKDLTGIENCMALNQIYLPDNEIVDLTPVKDMTQLTRLWLSDNKIDDISMLTGLINLKGISVGDAVPDISVVAGMTNLTVLAASGPFSDISVVANLPLLRELHLEDSQVSDLSVLADGFPRLIRLNLRNCPVSDIKPLVDNPNLRKGLYIDLRGCPLSDKSINEYIPELQERDVRIAQ